MKKILEWVWLDNTVLDYLISGLMIVVFWLLRRVIARLVALLVARFFTKKQDTERRQRFRELVVEPVERFLAITVVLLALDRLKFPSAFEFEIYHVSIQRILNSLATIAIIIAFIWLCNRIIQFASELLKIAAGQTTDRADDQLVVFFHDFLKVITWIVGLLLILKFAFGYNISNLLTGLSIVGAALALAFRESLENLIASFIIFFDKPFTTGDIVKVEHVTGTVDHIGLRSTRIRTTDKTYTTVPNKKMVDTIIDNQSLRSERNVQTRMEFDLDSPPETLLAFVQDVNSYLTQLDHVNDWNVFLADTGTQASVVQVDYFVSIALPVKQFFRLREAVNTELLTLKAKHGLRLAALNVQAARQR